MTISALPVIPSRADSPEDFSTKMDGLLGALPTLRSEFNADSADFNAKKSDFDAKYNAAMAAGLPNAAANAATANSKAAEAATSASQAATARSGAEAAWAAAIAANPDLNPVIRMNPSAINQSLVIPAGYNAYSAGPLEISPGATVEILENATWSILQ